MIYCDFGVLKPDERITLINKVFNALKPGGMFIFDVLNEYTLNHLKFEKSWEYAEKGFWRDGAYICLTESFHFPEKKAILDQYIVMDEKDQYELYRFWNHYFSEQDVFELGRKSGYLATQCDQNIITCGGLYNDRGVTFVKLTKE